MTFGLTPEGFNNKRLADILEEAETNLSNIVDPQSDQTLDPQFDSDDPAMQIVKVPLDGLSGGWDLFQAVTDQFDPNNASGPLLASLVQLNGITKNNGSPSTAPCLLTGTPGTEIPPGQIVSDDQQINLWVTDFIVVLDGAGQGTTQVSCQVVGPTSAPLGTINTILTSVPGWDTISNTATATLGELVETDQDLRVRRDQSTLAPAAAPAEAIWANLLNIEGVTFARVLSNRTLVTDSNGIPGKSIAAIVVGGDDTEIGEVLLSRTSDIADWFGNTSVEFFDLQGEPYQVFFIRPDDLDIWVEVDIEIINTATWPSNGAQMMADNIVTYSISGAPGLGVSDGFRQIGFLPGVDIEASRLYTPINSIPGHRIVELRIGTAPSPGVVATIPVAFDQQSRFDTSRIAVNIL